MGQKIVVRIINMDYALFVDVNSFIVFPPNWVILVILPLESTQMWGNECVTT